MKENIITQLPKNLGLLFKERSVSCAKRFIQAAKDSKGVFQYTTYSEFEDKVIVLAAALKNIGISFQTKVALISDNRPEWLLTDVALLSLGAIDVPRGSDSMGTEIRYIISYAECEYGFFENARQLQKIFDDINEVPKLKTAILFDTPTEEILQKAKAENITIYSFKDLEEKGKNLVSEKPIIKTQIELGMEEIKGSDVATIIFTSGTTGSPKGVMLTHRNFLAQLEVVKNVLSTKPGDTWMTILPVWHSFERTVQYIAVTLKTCLAYSKPIGSVLLADMATIKPNWICGVPRLWESLAQGIIKTMRKAGGFKYKMFKFFVAVGKKFAIAKEHVLGRVCQFKPRSRVLDAILGFFPMILLSPLYGLGNLLVYSKIRAKLGGKLVAAISGGGALQPETDLFYRALNISLLEGYGITEAGPVLSFRSCSMPRPGCVGFIFPSADIKIVKEEHGEILSQEPLPAGKQGLILAKGDSIMKGYYRRPDLTEKVVDKNGWLNTGDVGMLTLDGEIKITGRAKDTIVLLGGENIEPLEIENALAGSEFIETAVLFGQDKKFLGALIVPSKAAVEDFAKQNGIEYSSYEELIEKSEIKDLIQKQIDLRVCPATGFRVCERVYQFSLIPNSFTVGEELSAKQEFMRYKISAKYENQINKMFE